MFSCEQIFNHVYFEKHLRTDAFEILWKCFLIMKYHSKLVLKTYFMYILLSDCTNTFVIRLKNRRAKSDCRYGSMNNLVWRFKKWDPRWEKRKTSLRSWPCELEKGRSLFEINCILWTWNGVSNKLLWF